VWPNLAANVIWVPVAGIHHVMTKRHVTRLQDSHAEEIRGLHEKLDRLTNEEASDGRQGH